MRKMRVLPVILLMGIAVMISGCGDQIPDMTEEQFQAVEEYTARLLLSHDVNYQSRLVDLEFLATEESLEVSVPTATPQPENSGMDPVEDTPIKDLTDGQNTADHNIMSLEEILEFPEPISLSYEGYEVTESYSGSITGEYFTLDADAGKQLLVLHFSLRNQGEGTETADTMSKSLLVDISVNGISTYSLTTLLENDLTVYYENLNPGENREAVILAEYETQSLMDIASIEINVKNEDKNATIRLE